MPPPRASREQLVLLPPGGLDGHAPVADVHADRAPALAAGLGGARRDAARGSSARTARLVACADVEAAAAPSRTCSRRRRARPRGRCGRAPSALHRRRAAPARRGRRTCRARPPSAWPGEPGSMTWARPATRRPAVDQREADARAQADRDERRRRRRRPRARPSGPWSRPCPRAQAQAGEQLVDAAALGHEQEGDRAVLALDREVGVEQQRDVVARRSAGRTVATIAPSMSVADCGGSGSISRPVIAPSALM